MQFPPELSASHQRQCDCGYTRCAIGALAKKYFAHLKTNGGKCKRGFARDLLADTNKQAGSLEITRHDLNNEINRINAKRKAEADTVEQEQDITHHVSPSSPVVASQVVASLSVAASSVVASSIVSCCIVSSKSLLLRRLWCDI